MSIGIKAEPEYTPVSDTEEVATEAQSEFMEDLWMIEVPEEEEPFRGFEAIEAVEEVEQLGIAIIWPLTGAKLRIAHVNACTTKRDNLEDQWRRQNRKPPEQALPKPVEEELWKQALYRTVVLPWDSFPLNDKGDQLEFNKKNYRRVIESRRFRQFVLQASANAQKFRDAADESVRKN